ncbi:MAG: Ig-like domain-containing protein [Cyclobacteriaceae bacterium]
MKNLCLILLAFVFFNCGESEEEPRTLFRISIEASNGVRLAIGESTVLTALGFDQLGEPFNIESVNWTASNSTVTVDGTGRVTAQSVGVSIITAESQDVLETIEIRVFDDKAPRTEIYVSDAGRPVGNPPFQILKYDENGENPEVFISNQNVNGPQEILFLEDQGVVLISNIGSGRIARHDANTGALIDNFASNINGPTRIKIGPDGLLYVLQWNGTNPVLRYELDGTFVDAFTSIGINQSIGLAWDTDGNLYVSSFNNGSGGFVRKFDIEGNDLGLFVTSNSLQGPTNIWFDFSGDLFVLDWQAGLVKQFDSEGKFIANVITALSLPEGVTALPNGNILIGNGGNGSVKMYSSTFTFIKDLVAPGAGGLLTPNGVTVRTVNQ